MLRARGGEWDTQTTKEPLKHQDRKAKKVSIHPLFKESNLNFDFALVHLETPFELNEHIDTACLPDATFSEASFFPQNCFATGWGKDKFGEFLLYNFFTLVNNTYNNLRSTEAVNSI